MESIDDWAFQGCSSLLKAVIPSTVTYISVYDVFADCAKNFYILGYKESEAERYANENNIRFVDAANPVIPIEICDITLEQGAVEYDGTAKTPKVTVRDGDIELVEGEDYSVEYANNQDIGTASVTVTGIGNTYTGEKTLEFQIVEVSDELTETNSVLFWNVILSKSVIPSSITSLLIVSPCHGALVTAPSPLMVNVPSSSRDHIALSPHLFDNFSTVTFIVPVLLLL